MPYPNDRLAQTIIHSIHDEQRQDGPREPQWDEALTRLRQPELAARVSDAMPRVRDEHGVWKDDAASKPALKSQLLVLEYGHAELQASVDERLRAVPRGKRYAAQTIDFTFELRDAFGRLKVRFWEQLPRNEAGLALCDLVGRRARLDREAPIALADRAKMLVEAVADGNNAAMLTTRGFEPVLIGKEFAFHAKRIEEELRRGFGGDPRQGEGSDAVDEDVVFLEIAYRRLSGWLQDHGCRAEADRLEAHYPRLPRKNAPKPESDKVDETAKPAEGATPEATPTAPQAQPVRPAPVVAPAPAPVVAPAPAPYTNGVVHPGYQEPVVPAAPVS